MYLSKFLKLFLLLSLLALVLPLSIASAEVAGTAVITDSSAGLSDQVVVSLTDVPRLGATEAYEGWLVSDDGAHSLSIGVMAVDTDGSINLAYTDAQGTNLTSIYDKFVITVEPVPDTDPGLSSHVAFSDQIPAGGMVHIRHLLYSSAGNPEYASGAHAGTPKGISPGLGEQTDLARVQAGLAAGSSTLADIKAHAANVINIIEGAHGDNFVSSEADPGDGFGVLNYAADAKNHAQLITADVPSDATFAKYEPHVSDSSDNVADWAGMARDQAVIASNATNVAVAQAFMTNAQTLLTRALNGHDADRDGTIESIIGEGGASQVQVGVQNMGTYNPTEVVIVEAPPTPPATGDISWGVFALIALTAGAVLLGGGGLLFARGRASA